MMVARNEKLNPHIRGHITTYLHNYKNVILPFIISKMSLRVWPNDVDELTNVAQMWQ